MCLIWSTKQTAGDSLKKKKKWSESVRRKDWNVKTRGWEVQRCPCCDGTVSEAPVQRAQRPARRPLKPRCKSMLGVVCHSGGVCVCSACSKTTGSACLCEFACTHSRGGRGRGLILIISCQALGLTLQTRWCKLECVSGPCVHMRVCDVAPHLRKQAGGSVPDLVTGGIFGPTTRAF